MVFPFARTTRCCLCSSGRSHQLTPRSGPVTSQPGLLDQIHRICGLASKIAGGRGEGKVKELRQRLGEPLRVAIAGRLKAGKSTLLNALVGERLAATDAGECTRLVTWYRRGDGYFVGARLEDGTERELRFSREGGSLTIDLAEAWAEDVDYLDVRWPTGRLAQFTLVDTPGLESLDTDRSERTKQLLGIEEAGHSRVDAVIYLMRHLHRSDADFLEAFMDRSLSHPSPVNAVAVLSRADEVGAGRLNAMESAGAIASRYAADRLVRSFCSTVLPVDGLLAETGFTLREAEVSNLRQLANMPTAELNHMLVSVDRFCAPGLSPLTVEYRRDLLMRLGLFGLRFSLQQLKVKPNATTSQLAADMVAESGIEALIEVLEDHLGVRSTVLKARSALIELRGMAREVSEFDPDGSKELESAIERVESGAHEFSELRLMHLLMTGAVSITDEQREEITRLISEGDPIERLGLHPQADMDRGRMTALERVEEWRRRAAHPLTDRVTAEAFETIARTYETVYADLTPGT